MGNTGKCASSIGQGRIRTLGVVDDPSETEDGAWTIRLAVMPPDTTSHEPAGIELQIGGGLELGERVERAGPLDASEAIELALSCARQLEAIHHVGLLHLGVAPSTVILRSWDDASRRTAVLVGSRAWRPGSPCPGVPAGVQLDAVRFCSPEHSGLIDRSLGPSSDLFSLGLVLFYAVTGRRPFEGADDLAALLAAPLPDPRSLGARIPMALAGAICRLTRKEPRERYQIASALADDLEELRARRELGDLDPPVAIGSHDRRTALARPALVDFVPELDAVEAFVGALRRGRAPFLVVDGPSGSGKSRLLQELRTRAARDGLRVFFGRGVAEEPPRPFSILASLCAQVAEEAGRDPAFAEAFVSRIGDCAPALVDALPELRATLRAREPTPLVPELFAGERTLRALRAFLAALGSKARPALVVLDDCQRSAPLALELLGQWGTTTTSRERYVGVACSCGADERREGCPLRTGPEATRLSLRPFSSAATRLLAESMAGPLPEEVHETVLRLSGGNPFMISAVVHGMVECGALRPGAEGWELKPQLLSELTAPGHTGLLLARRLAWLPERARAVLSRAAVLGRELDPALLARLLDDASIADALFDAEQRHLVWKRPDGDTYAFAHDEIRAILLGELDPDERRAMHRRLAEHWQATAPDRVFDLAFHFDAAGDARRAHRYALEAARAARTRHALDVAEQMYRVAGGGAPREARQAVTAGLGEVLLLRGKYEEARPVLEEALALAGDVLEKARVRSFIADLEFKRGRLDVAAQAFEEALAWLGEPVPRSRNRIVLSVGANLVARWLGAPARRRARNDETQQRDLLVARLLGHLADIYYLRGAGRLAWPLVRRLRITERYPATSERAEALAQWGLAQTHIPRMRSAYRDLTKALAIHDDLDDPWGRAQCLHRYGVALYIGARYREAEDAARRAMTLFERAGDRREYNDAHLVLGGAQLRRGELRQARRTAEQVHHEAAAIGDAHAIGVALDLWARSSGGAIPGELTAGELTRGGGDVTRDVLVMQAEALRLAAEGEVDRALGWLERARGEVAKADMRSDYVSQLPLYATQLLRSKIATLPVYAIEERARHLIQAHEAIEQGLRLARAFRNNLPQALREAALVALLEGEQSRARQLFEHSMANAVTIGARYEAEKTRLERAKVARDLGWEGWADELATARRELVAMGAEFELGAHERPITLSLVERFSSLLRLGRRIIGQTERERIVAEVEDAGRRLLRAEYCILAEGEALHELDDQLGSTTQDFPFVFTPKLIDEVRAHLPDPATRSLMCAPLVVEGGRRACLLAGHTEIYDLFSDEEMRLAQFITTLASVALENAESFGRVHEALRVREEFLQIASHELKTPIASLRLHFEALARALGRRDAEEDPEKIRQLLTSGERQLRRLTSLADQLLDVSRLETGRLALDVQRVDLVRLVREIVHDYHGQAVQLGCELVVTTPVAAWGYWDPTLLEEVVVNLLTNAMKYGPAKPVEIALTERGDGYGVSFTDHGIGIAPQDQERIFERFERAVPSRYYGGLGLGLYIAKRIVEAHQGSIEVRSSPGEGATFSFEIPAQALRAQARPDS